MCDTEAFTGGAFQSLHEIEIDDGWEMVSLVGNLVFNENLLLVDV